MNDSKYWGCMLAALAFATTCRAQAPAARVASVRASYELPALGLAKLQNAQLPESIANDRKILFGGVGSDLWHGANDAADEFWLLTDRGPNGEVESDGQRRRTLLVPEFTPHVVHVRAKDGALTVLDAIALVGASGKPVTGLPNREGYDEVPYDAIGTRALVYAPSGLDTEGLVRTANGEFWLAEEYGPSLVRVASSGKVLVRYVPAGVQLEGADYKVSPALPAIYAKRKHNRGFEGVGLSRDQKTLYLLLQSPLSVPDKQTADGSRQARILAFDIATEKPVAEYVYRFELAADIDPQAAGDQGELKLSAVVALDGHRLLVLERTDELAKLFLVDLEGASNILGTPWDDPSTTPSLESLADLASVRVAPVAKRLAVDLAAVEGLPRKLEGVAVLDATTIALANDNDFDVGELDAVGDNVGKGTASRLILITLAKPLF